jgi:hypothetical protein
LSSRKIPRDTKAQNVFGCTAVDGAVRRAKAKTARSVRACNLSSCQDATKSNSQVSIVRQCVVMAMRRWPDHQDGAVPPVIAIPIRTPSQSFPEPATVPSRQKHVDRRISVPQAVNHRPETGTHLSSLDIVWRLQYAFRLSWP